MTSPRVALVTGGSSGIGEDTALRLKEKGFEVYAVARRVDKMQALADRGVHVFGMDVTDDGSMTEGIKRILDEQGRIDLLVNNAGYGSFGSVEDVPIDEARRQFEVNLFGLARLIQLVLPTMRAQHSGLIVNISSIGGHFYEPLGAWYHATKHAVEGFSDSLRLELKPHGIDVAIIEPAAIRSEWADIAAESMLDTAKGGAYEDQARKAAAVFERTYGPAMSSGPSVVGKAIAKAATARRPRTRYPVGKGARTIIASRRMLPDRVFDKVVHTMFTR
jgi:short-subunit dehydrogenase